MSLTTLVGPASEPVSLAALKVRARIDHTDDDAFLTALIETARDRVERLTGLRLISQRVEEVHDCWLIDRAGQIVLQARPVLQIHSVSTIDQDGTSSVLDPSAYYADIVAVPARLVWLAHGSGWPAPGRTHAGVVITYQAGFGNSAEEVPAPLREAVAQLAIDGYVHQNPAERDDETALPLAVQGLLAPFVQRRV